MLFGSLIRLLFGLLLSVLVTPLPAETLEFSSGNKRVHLLELYTSQGCSSCPPAEAWLNQLIQHKGLWSEIIPLAFHVDYWDYLGWKDPFSNSLYSRRQQQYRQEGGVRAVYTPGMVLNGQEWRRGQRQPPDNTKEPVPILRMKISAIKVGVTLDGVVEKPLRLNLALLGFDIQTSVRAGENRGRRLSQEFVVLGYTTRVSDNGRWQAQIPQPVNDKAGRFALVAWVSDANTQRPIQATGGWVPARLIASTRLE